MLPALFLVVGMNTGTGTGIGTGTMTGVGVVYMARGVGTYKGTGTGMKYLSGSAFPSVMSNEPYCTQNGQNSIEFWPF